MSKNHINKKIEFPIDIPGGYYARDYHEYKFDEMLRNHAKETGKEAMYSFIRDQDLRNRMRRLDDKLDAINDKLSHVETGAFICSDNDRFSRFKGDEDANDQ